MQVPDTSKRFSSLQLELLKIFSFNPTEEELLQVKHMLADFFMDRILDQIQEAGEKKGITDADLEAFLNAEDQ